MKLLSIRIQEILDEGFTQADLTRAAGVSKGTTSQWLDGKIQSIKLQYALGIQSLTGFNANWIVTGEGRKKLSEAAEEIDLENNPDYPAIKKVSIRLSAGISGFAIDHIYDDSTPIVFKHNWYTSRGYKPENLFALIVSGHSMESGLGDGDTIVINTADTTPKDGEAFAVNYEGELVVKRLVRNSGEWWLNSDNPDQRRYPPKVCNGDSCIIIGRVIHKQSERI